MAENYLKTCSKSLAIREMQIKTILRFHLILSRMAKIKTQEVAHVGEDVEQGNTPFLERVQTCTTTLENNLAVSRKIGKYSRKLYHFWEFSFLLVFKYK